MKSYRDLASQTAVYGVSSVVGRLLNNLLTPLYTYTLSRGEYGVVTEMYAYVSFLIVLLTFGMETAFFRYNEKHHEKKSVFASSCTLLAITSLSFIVLTIVLRQPIANLIHYPQHPEYIWWFGMIIGLDAFTAIPFAKLRAEGRALRFMAVRMGSIGINITLNLFFILLVPYLIRQHFGALLGDGKWFVDVRYIFISNIAASLGSLLMLSSVLRGIKWKIDRTLMRSMLAYGLPLIVFGLAGIVNETLDRILLKYLLPPDIAMDQLGIYSACYKIAILMTVFIQAYRYAAEPFFFAKARDDDARLTYAGLMHLFMAVMSMIFAATMLYLDVVLYFIGPGFRLGAAVIPILLMANLFLGVFYNLSVWYKLTDRTLMGALISVFGAVITITLNIWLIPIIGYMGSAWATFACYASMMVVSYFAGQKFYRIPYDLPRMVLMPGLAALVWYLSTLTELEGSWKLILNTILLLGFGAALGLIIRKELSLMLHPARSIAPKS